MLRLLPHPIAMRHCHGAVNWSHDPGSRRQVRGVGGAETRQRREAPPTKSRCTCTDTIKTSDDSLPVSLVSFLFELCQNIKPHKVMIIIIIISYILGNEER